MNQQDTYFMKLALEEAELAFDRDEVPIGAVLVSPDGILAGRGFNQPIAAHDPTAHAEIMALRAGAAFVKNYRLTGFTLYVTLEPCIMCFGALIHARIGRLVFGAPDTRSGVRQHLPWINSMHLNHEFVIEGPVMEKKCADLIQQFFQIRRSD